MGENTYDFDGCQQVFHNFSTNSTQINPGTTGHRCHTTAVSAHYIHEPNIAQRPPSGRTRATQPAAGHAQGISTTQNAGGRSIRGGGRVDRTAGEGRRAKGRGHRPVGAGFSPSYVRRGTQGCTQSPTESTKTPRHCNSRGEDAFTDFWWIAASVNSRSVRLLGASRSCSATSRGKNKRVSTVGRVLIAVGPGGQIPTTRERKQRRLTPRQGCLFFLWLQPPWYTLVACGRNFTNN